MATLIEKHEFSMPGVEELEGGLDAVTASLGSASAQQKDALRGQRRIGVQQTLRESPASKPLARRDWGSSLCITLLLSAKSGNFIPSHR